MRGALLSLCVLCAGEAMADDAGSTLELRLLLPIEERPAKSSILFALSKFTSTELADFLAGGVFVMTPL